MTRPAYAPRAARLVLAALLAAGAAACADFVTVSNPNVVNEEGIDPVRDADVLSRSAFQDFATAVGDLVLHGAWLTTELWVGDSSEDRNQFGRREVVDANQRLNTDLWQRFARGLATSENVGELLGDAPDLIVGAAGAFGLARLHQAAPEDFDRQLAANLRGPFLLVRAFLPAMLGRRAGHFIHIGSIAGRAAFPENGAYSASKFGLRGLHEVLLQEIRGTGVRATLVEPAATDTPLWDPIDPDARADLPPRTSMLPPEDVARAVLFAAQQPPSVQISSIAVQATG